MSREAATLARIAAVAALMFAGVFVAGTMVRGGKPQWRPAALLSVDPDALPGEADTFRMDSKGLALKASSQEKGGSRTLDKFDRLRAFAGAPPVIPHALLEDRTMGGKGCLGCHRGGGFVPQFKAYAPVTPHPELLNCRQCHVPQKETTAFASGTTWETISGPPIRQAALQGAPPPIPHTLEMRGNCVACHAGPGAVAEIRTPHPDRSNCRQCHVPTEATGVFDRGGIR